MSLDTIDYRIHSDKNVTAEELADLLSAVGWYNGDGDLGLAIQGTTFVAHVRDGEGKLLGYASALSDGVFTTFVDMVLVRPEAQRHGIGRALVKAVETHFSGVPMYAMPFTDLHEFFLKLGYWDKTQKARRMVPMSKRNPAAA